MFEWLQVALHFSTVFRGWCVVTRLAQPGFDTVASGLGSASSPCRMGTSGRAGWLRQ